MRWKTMVVDARKGSHTFSQPDLFIAAIAALEDLVAVSRDTSEFIAARVPVFDPWASVVHTHGKAIALNVPITAEAVAKLVVGRRR